MSTEQLLPPSLRNDLRIANVAADESLIRFRLDPGRMFERHGYIRTETNGSLTAGISQRHQPDGDLAWAVTTGGLTAPIVPGYLRILAQCADDQVAVLPHWRKATATTDTPEDRWPLNQPDAFRQAAKFAAEQARDDGHPRFLSGDSDTIACLAGPPPARWFWSVTPFGEWSFHKDERTRPIDRSPVVLHPRNDPVRTAARDRTLASEGLMPVGTVRPARHPSQRATSRGRR